MQSSRMKQKGKGPKLALEVLVEKVEDVSQIIVNDETYKDRQASFRRREWERVEELN